MLKLKTEFNSFRGNDGKQVEFTAYYVEVLHGVKVYLKPVDKTGRQLLDLELSKKEDKV